MGEFDASKTGLLDYVNDTIKGQATERERWTSDKGEAGLYLYGPFQEDCLVVIRVYRAWADNYKHWKFSGDEAGGLEEAEYLFGLLVALGSLRPVVTKRVED